MQPTHCHLWSETPKQDELRNHLVFDTLTEYEEDDHRSRALLRCKTCSQLYFYAFDEEVDWENGNDPQFRTWIPVTSAEEAVILSGQSRIQFAKFSPRLEYAWPADAEVPEIKWIGRP